MALTWKRTWVWANSSWIRELDLGPLLPAERPTTVKTTKRKKTADGKVKWQGTAQLKGTQFFDCILKVIYFFRVYIIYSIYAI